MKIHTHHITPAYSQLFIENDKRWYPLKIHNATIHKKMISYFLEFKFYKSYAFHVHYIDKYLRQL